MLLGEKNILEGILENAEWEKYEESGKDVCQCGIRGYQYDVCCECLCVTGYGNIRLLMHYQ